MLAKFSQNCASNIAFFSVFQHSAKFQKFFKNLSEILQILQSFCRNLQDLRARKRFSCRSRKTLTNITYLDAKIGVNPAENEPRKECLCRGRSPSRLARWLRSSGCARLLCPRTPSSHGCRLSGTPTTRKVRVFRPFEISMKLSKARAKLYAKSKLFEKRSKTGV